MCMMLMPVAVTADAASLHAVYLVEQGRMCAMPQMLSG